MNIGKLENNMSEKLLFKGWWGVKLMKVFIFQKSFESSRKISPKTVNFNFIPLQIPEYNQVKDNQSTILRRAETGSVVNKCPVIPLEHVESTPPMQYWTHTEANVIVSMLKYLDEFEHFPIRE